MLFRRRAHADGFSVAVALAAGSSCAAGLDLSTGQRPTLAWFRHFETASTPVMLRALSDAGLLDGTDPVVAMARHQYQVVVGELPDLPRAEWRDAMRWSVKEQVEVDVDDAIIDVLEIPRGDAPSRGGSSAMVMLAGRSVVHDLWLQADDQGVTWSALETAETALRNMSALAESADQAHALLVFGADHAQLVITLRGELMLSRIIEVSRSALNVSDDLRGGALGRAGLEVLRTLDTYERTKDSAPLSGLSVVVPHGARNVVEELSDLVYVPVRPLDMAALLDVPATLVDEAPLGAFHTLEAWVVVGAALRPWSVARAFQQVDLRIPEAQEMVQSWSATWALKGVTLVAVLAVVTALVASSVNLVLQQRIGKVEAQLAPLQAQVAQQVTPPGMEELEQLRRTEGLQQKLMDALARIVAGSANGYGEFLMGLGRQTMDGVWVTRFRVANDGQDMELSGRLMQPTLLPAYIDRLRKEEEFKGRTFEQVDMKALDIAGLTEGQVTDFSLKGSVLPTQGADTATVANRGPNNGLPPPGALP